MHASNTALETKPRGCRSFHPMDIRIGTGTGWTSTDSLDGDAVDKAKRRCRATYSE